MLWKAVSLRRCKTSRRRRVVGCDQYTPATHDTHFSVYHNFAFAFNTDPRVSKVLSDVTSKQPSKQPLTPQFKRTRCGNGFHILAGLYFNADQFAEAVNCARYSVAATPSDKYQFLFAKALVNCESKTTQKEAADVLRALLVIAFVV